MYFYCICGKEGDLRVLLFRHLLPPQHTHFKCATEWLAEWDFLNSRHDFLLQAVIVILSVSTIRRKAAINLFPDMAKQLLHLNPGSCS